MKSTTILKIVVGLSLFALLSGCFITTDSGVGAVGIELPEPESSGTGAYDYARIFVINGSASLPLGSGTDYVQVGIEGSDNEVSVGPIPSGSGYQVILVVGNIDTDSGVFIPEYYVTSDPITVYAGEVSEITLDPEQSPFVPVDPADTLGVNLVGMVFNGTNLYAASADGIMVAPLVVDLQTDVITNRNVDFGAIDPITSGEIANSLTLGALWNQAAVPFLNTDEGILPYNGVFQYTFDDTSGIGREILDSGAFRVGTELYAYFQYDGGLGGVWDNAGTQDWLSEVDLSDFVSGQPVYDLAVVNDGGTIFGYFASKLGAFRLSDTLLSDTSVDTAQEVFDYPDTIFFSAKVDNIYALITTIDVDGGGDVYLGTTLGVIRTTVTELETVSGTAEPWVDGDSSDPTTMVVESLGRYVEQILTGGGYVAIRTPQFLIVSNDGGDTFAAVPLAASSAGQVTAMFLDSASGVVLVAGSTGVAGMDIDDV